MGSGYDIEEVTHSDIYTPVNTLEFHCIGISMGFNAYFHPHPSYAALFQEFMLQLDRLLPTFGPAGPLAPC